LPENVLINTIPVISSLTNPTIQEIVKALNAKVLFGASFLNNQIGSFSIGAMQLRNYLLNLKDNALVITPGDRADIILGALQANESVNYPSISGIVLTGNIVPEDSILKLIEGLSTIVPIISVEGGTYMISNKIGDIKPKIYAEDPTIISSITQQQSGANYTGYEYYVDLTANIIDPCSAIYSVLPSSTGGSGDGQVLFSRCS
jgi:phosphate acetyltransferase